VRRPTENRTHSLFAPRALETIRRPDGSILLRSPQPLADYGRCVGDWLVHWAMTAPDRPFLLERSPEGAWTGTTYSEALRCVRSIAAWLIHRGCSAERPVGILSGNSVRHALVALASMHVGIPVASISPAYSIAATGFGKLQGILGQIRPGAIYCADAVDFDAALSAIRDLHDGPVLADSKHHRADAAWAEVIGAGDDERVDRAFAAVGPDTIAKFLFTSGSTGTPKAVVTTQRMLLANQQQMRQVWPFLDEHVPVLVDWLPWSHTFGGSHNFNLVLRSGGTLHIDTGRPLAQQFTQTIANLREIAPTLYFNVPRGFDMLLPVLRADHAFRQHFFSRLRLMFSAAAALPQHLWEALHELCRDATADPVPIVSGWGSTETAPLVTSCHFEAPSAAVIGLPVPGVELKLVPQGPKLEVRVRGPNVTPGYWNRADLTAQAFDEEGFYRIGDAVRPVRENDFKLGLLFDGRVSEDFKLSTGTWVDVGAVRLRAIAALTPFVQDAVVTGHDRDWLGLLLFPNVVTCRQLCSDMRSDAPLDQVLADARIRHKIRLGLQELRRRGTGSSTYATRALLLSEPPSIEAGEITDKGYINQRAVLERRSALVEALYCPDSTSERSTSHSSVVALEDQP
jgi:feruloyl-CoA synthase